MIVAAMLLTASMSAYWWVQAARYFTYIYNRTPHSALQLKTPYEVFYGKKPRLPKFFPVFGCLAIALDHLRQKSSMFKGKFAAFLGIDSSGRYNLMNLTTRQIFTSESVRSVQVQFPLKHKGIEKRMAWEQTARLEELRAKGVVDSDDEDEDQEDQEQEQGEPEQGGQDQVVHLDYEEPEGNYEERYSSNETDENISSPENNSEEKIAWEEDQRQEDGPRYPTRIRELSADTVL